MGLQVDYRSNGQEILESLAKLVLLDSLKLIFAKLHN